MILPKLQEHLWDIKKELTPEEVRAFKIDVAFIALHGRFGEDGTVQKLLEKEQELQQQYSPEIQQQTTEWWTKEASELHELSTDQKNTEMSQVYKRVLGYLSLNCYMLSTGSLKQGDLVAAHEGPFVGIFNLKDHSPLGNNRVPERQSFSMRIAATPNPGIPGLFPKPFEGDEWPRNGAPAPRFVSTGRSR